ncbi:MAG TPA: nitrous oxide reductase accessory protein NosL [Ignavibacteria bacterium]|nr:nitrous oxide reductase accessory protein NosL [Ignavibacteria bacterium]HMR41164.1 nitrous oxide reductase accessory protein NosL [Ignavibacteria bacterium]
MLKLKLNFFIIVLVLLSSCSKEISQIEYGKDQCEFCKMIITDQKYGALIFTKKGKSIKFDAAECMLNFEKENNIDPEDIDEYFIINFTEPGVITDATSATYLISPELHSPMGENISAFKNKTDAEKYQKDYDGELLDWDDLNKDYLKNDR